MEFIREHRLFIPLNAFLKKNDADRINMVTAGIGIG
jgi:hypothetical protein